MVTIIMPCFNSASFIRDSIESILNQNYSNWELLVIDDYSDDNSERVVNELKDNRISYLKNKYEKGTANARTTGIEVAKGDYIAFLDSDDIWLNDKLSKHISFMIAKRVNFSYTNYYITSLKNSNFIEKKCPKKITYKSMLNMSKIGTLTVIIKSEYIKGVKIPNLRKRNDYALWLKVLKKTDGYLFDMTLSNYIVRSESLSSGSKLRLLKYHYKLFRESEKFNFFKAVYYTLVNVILYVLSRNKNR